MHLPNDVLSVTVYYGGLRTVAIDELVVHERRGDVRELLTRAGLDVEEPYETFTRSDDWSYVFKGQSNRPHSGPRCCRP